LQPISVVERAIAVENKWSAQRYGVDCIFASKDGPIEIRSMLFSLIEQISEDASILGCLDEVESCKAILQRGSSADYQLRTFHETGGSVLAVKKWIASATAPAQRKCQAPHWQDAIV